MEQNKLLEIMLLIQTMPPHDPDEEILVFPVFPYVFDGSTWDRLRGDSNNGLVSKKRAASEASYTAVTALETTYNNTTTSANGADISNSFHYTHALILLDVDKAGSPTSIQIKLEFKDDTSTYYPLNQTFLGRWVISAASIGTGFQASYIVPVSTGDFRFSIEANDTTASDTITVNSFEYKLVTR